MADKMFPGWQEKLWARYPQGYKEYVVKSENDKFEAGIAQHKWWQGLLLSYKSMEASFKPSAKYRKPGVDWRRQIERGTMHYGRWYEGPNGSDYRPGNTFDRLENVRAPFTPEERAAPYRSLARVSLHWEVQLKECRTISSTLSTKGSASEKSTPTRSGSHESSTVRTT